MNNFYNSSQRYVYVNNNGKEYVDKRGVKIIKNDKNIDMEVNLNDKKSIYRSFKHNEFAKFLDDVYSKNKNNNQTLLENLEGIYKNLKKTSRKERRKTQKNKKKKPAKKSQNKNPPRKENRRKTLKNKTNKKTNKKSNAKKANMKKQN